VRFLYRRFQRAQAVIQTRGAGLDADKLDDELSEVCPKTDFGYLVLKSAKVNLRKAVERVERPVEASSPTDPGAFAKRE